MTELVMSHFTLPRFHPIHDRVRLAAENGFDGIGLYISHYAQLEDEGFAPNGLAELLDEHGIRLREIEVVKRLGADEDDRSEVAWRMVIELVSGLLIGFGIGYGLDWLFGTTPILMVLFFFFGFAAGIKTMLGTAAEMRKKQEAALAAAEGQAAEAASDKRTERGD